MWRPLSTPGSHSHRLGGVGGVGQLQALPELRLRLQIAFVPPRTLLWMDEILHHFETTGNHAMLVFTGESNHSRVSWMVQEFVHPQYVLGKKMHGILRVLAD